MYASLTASAAMCTARSKHRPLAPPLPPRLHRLHHFTACTDFLTALLCRPGNALKTRGPSCTRAWPALGAFALQDPRSHLPVFFSVVALCLANDETYVCVLYVCTCGGEGTHNEKERASERERARESGQEGGREGGRERETNNLVVCLVKDSCQSRHITCPNPQALPPPTCIRTPPCRHSWRLCLG